MRRLEMTKVKICGITNWEDAKRSLDLGASALGFNFCKASPRYIKPAAARRIQIRLPAGVQGVGVFVNNDIEDLEEIAGAADLDVIQLHGEETSEFVRRVADHMPAIKAFRIAPRFRVAALAPYKKYVQAFLLDGFDPRKRGGTGKTADWSVARAAKKYGPIFLAGGLNPENVGDAICAVRPDYVDVASGVESDPGKKDPAKLRAFFRTVEAANRELTR